MEGTGPAAESVRSLLARLAACVLQAEQPAAIKEPGALRRAQDEAHSILLGLSPVSLAAAAAAAKRRRHCSRRPLQGLLAGTGPPRVGQGAAADRPPRSPCASPQDAAPAHVPPDQRAARAEAGIAAAAGGLREAGYPGLAADLEAATARLQR